MFSLGGYNGKDPDMQPWYKTKNKKAISDRGISLLCCLYKKFTLSVYQRLLNWSENYENYRRANSVFDMASHQCKLPPI